MLFLQLLCVCFFFLFCFVCLALQQTLVFSNALRSTKTVYFQHSYFKITWRTQRRIVKCLTSIGFAIPNIFVHPNCLTLTAKQMQKTNQFHCKWKRFFFSFLIFVSFTRHQSLSSLNQQPWTAQNRAPSLCHLRYPPRGI